MVGRQNVPIHLKWAAMVSTLRTTGLKSNHYNQLMQQQGLLH